ncbi:TetR/AcrR family transcriptional regulator [Nonomuraea recticatena]|uniref:TetR/AcrR family transcriptional regulator n=1 Tax=Nonomuraea recticatena TaxID=46178 RepID=UPI0036235536
MSTPDHVRERTILDATAELLLRIGYNKLTMGDVADAVSLHRGLVYLVFKSKDELVEAVVHDELSRYADAWREHLEADPRAGDVASVYRAMMGALKTLPLAAAIVARAEDVFGKYLRKRGASSSGCRRSAGAVTSCVRCGRRGPSIATSTCGRWPTSSTP